MKQSHGLACLLVLCVAVDPGCCGCCFCFCTVCLQLILLLEEALLGRRDWMIIVRSALLTLYGLEVRMSNFDLQLTCLVSFGCLCEIGEISAMLKLQRLVHS